MTRVLLFTTTLLLTACGSAEELTPAPVAESVPAFPSQNIWTIDYDKSDLTFSGIQEDVRFTGTFTDYIVQVSLDPTTPETGQIRVTVDTGSAITGDSERDNALPGKDWFNTKAYPKAVFTSESISQIGRETNRFVAEGDLRLKSTTLPVSLPFTLEMNGSFATARGQLTLDRSQFDVGSGNYATDQWIAYPVEVDFILYAMRAE